MANDGLVSGIRELNEGLFKYHEDGSHIEISDRILFIGATSLKSPIHAANMLESVKCKKNKANSSSDVEINEAIRDIQMEIVPNFECRHKTINNYISKRRPKPKMFD